MNRILVAGVGNIFLSDDGFGCEVVRRLAGEELPEGVTVADFGIKGVHLAYELLEGYDTVVIVDAAPCGGEPGSLYLIEPQLEEVEFGSHDGAVLQLRDNTPVIWLSEDRQ